MRVTKAILVLVGFAFIGGCAVLPEFSNASTDVSDDNLAVFDNRAYCAGCIREISKLDGTSVFRHRLEERISSPIKLVPGTYVIAYRSQGAYGALQGPRAYGRDKVDVKAGHRYAVMGIDCTIYCRFLSGPESKVWIEDTTTGEVLGCHRAGPARHLKC